LFEFLGVGSSMTESV